ncbi:MAG TPA: hypothetical protein VET85_03855 [Stellaceae bacterium]|nr:hypothetical protein [Stellaceae bacterium]
MADLSIDIDSVHNIDPVTLNPVTLNPITIHQIEKIAPAAVHIKELNQIDPLTIESLRVDGVRNLEPLNVDRLNVTHLPVVNLALGRLPEVEVNVGRVPPVAIALHQDFDLPSRYTVHARVLGLELARLEIHGSTRLVPRERARREQSRVHERSFPDVAALGNPAIATQRLETCVEAVTRTEPPPPPAATARMGRALQAAASAIAGALSAGAPRFQYSLGGAPAAPPTGQASASSVSFGGQP